jgi:DNA-binding response OmpR family regulator
LKNGIEPEDYIWKEVEDYKERIKICIRRMVKSERGIKKIKIFKKDGDGLVVIDDVEVPLDPVYFRTFYCLCSLYRYPQSPQRILEDRNERYGEYENYDSPEVISDHIYNIRKKIQETFKGVERSVNPNLIIETVSAEEDEEDDEENYIIRRDKIRIDIKEFEEYSSKLREVVYPSSVSVLIIENDLHWFEIIREFLNELGYKTEIAHSVEESMKKAREMKPDLICLDMHLPKDQEEWNKNPKSGRIEGGFDALTKIREELKDIGVVVLTEYYEKNDLREMAMQKGIDINHWVGKDENWKGNLAYAVWRLTREYELGIKTPAEDDIYSLLRIQLRRSNKRIIFIDEVKIGLSENRGKLIWTLAQTRGSVSREKILEEVYGEDVDKWPQDEARALNSLVDDTRRIIREELQKVGKSLDPKKIIMETPNGYRLKGLVLITN